jgi:hypothetical protein
MAKVLTKMASLVVTDAHFFRNMLEESIGTIPILEEKN